MISVSETQQIMRQGFSFRRYLAGIVIFVKILGLKFLSCIAELTTIESYTHPSHIVITPEDEKRGIFMIIHALHISL
jgi:hypothetical protein